MEHLPKSVCTVTKQELEPFSSGKRVGSYLIGRTIGQGSFAKVKEAIHVSTGEKVAIKIINKRKAKQDRYVSRNLKREAEIMQKLRHKNIVGLMEVMETDMFYYLVTELCSGGELLDLICERKHLDEETTRKYVQQLVSAVNAMHQTGVVHRDLKIENFLLDEEDNLKIVDFGLSNTLSASALETWGRIGMCPLLLTTHCGSPAYAAPELLAQKPYGAQVDIWSIGVNMFAMLTGTLPYNLEPFNIIDMYHRMIERRMTPFPKYISQEARDLIMQLLDPIPESRITLEKAANHSWLRSPGKSLLRCGITAGRIASEVNQNIVMHMADHMGLSMKDVVNSVTRNRASHSFAIYFLLSERLKRYEKRKREEAKGMGNEKSFPKVKVVKKATLNTEINPRSKFTYKGVKITRGSISQPFIEDKDSDSAKSDADSEPEIAQLIESTGHWNQYATFPRDRRTACRNQSKTNSGRLVNATLDKGSDDIDYHRVSSPETTDNSASSLESTLILQSNLLNTETSDLMFPRGRLRRESGSDEEFATRTRSKSLTGREEYDCSHIVLSSEGRSRTSSMASTLNFNDIQTARQASPFHQTVIHPPCKLLRSLSPNLRHFKVLDNELKGTVIIESQESFDRDLDHEISTQSNNFHCSLANASASSNKENLSISESSESGSVGSGTLKLPKTRILKLNQSGNNAKIKAENRELVEGLTEVIPPPTPFRDQGLTMNIELLGPKEARTIHNEKRTVVNSERKEVADEQSKRNTKTKTNRKHHGKISERSKSLSDLKVHSSKAKDFKKLEVEKVRKIELEPFRNPAVQVAPVIQMMSPFSLQRAKQESQCSIPSKLHQLRITTDPEVDHNNNCIDSIGNLENSDDRESVRASPFKLDVLRVNKSQCIPIFRAEFVEPRKLLDCKKGLAIPIESTNEKTTSQTLKTDKHVLSIPQGHDIRQSTSIDNSRRRCSSADKTWSKKLNPHIDEASMTELDDRIQSSATADHCRQNFSSGKERYKEMSKPCVGKISTKEMDDKIQHLAATDNSRITACQLNVKPPIGETSTIDMGDGIRQMATTMDYTRRTASSANTRRQQHAECGELPTEMGENSRQMLLGANNRPVFFIERYTKGSLGRSRSFNENDLLEKSENGKMCITNDKLRPRLKYRAYSGGISVKPRTNSHHGQVITVNDPEEYERFEDSQSAKDSKES